MRDAFVIASLLAALIAAALGVMAATITIRNSMDDFITDLHRQGTWASWAAVAAAVSAALQAIAYWLGNSVAP